MSGGLLVVGGGGGGGWEEIREDESAFPELLLFSPSSDCRVSLYHFRVLAFFPCVQFAPLPFAAWSLYDMIFRTTHPQQSSTVLSSVMHGLPPPWSLVRSCPPTRTSGALEAVYWHRTRCVYRVAGVSSPVETGGVNRRRTARTHEYVLPI